MFLVKNLKKLNNPGPDRFEKDNLDIQKYKLKWIGSVTGFKKTFQVNRWYVHPTSVIRKYHPGS